MNQLEILWPAVALAGLTFIVLGVVPMRRFAAVGKKEVGPEDFAYGESAKVPGYVAVANRNYMNLLENPVLFYVAVIGLYVTSLADGLSLALAWGFVGLRAVHSLIHLTYNKVLHRLGAFALANFVLIALWVVFALRLWAAE